MRRRRRMLILTTVLVLTMVVAATPAAGRGADDGFEVVAEGLDNPRGVDVDWWGRVYVAEAGRGGDALVATPQGGGPGPVCVGSTGAISRIVRGEVRRIVSSLPSVTDAIEGECAGPGFGTGATGPHGVDRSGSRLRYSTGLGGSLATRDALAETVDAAADLGQVFNQRRGRVSTTDLVAFEEVSDPDQAPNGPDSNPYGLISGSRRSTIAVDSGGNSLVRLRHDGSTDVLAVFAPRCVPFELGPNPIPTDENPCGDDALFPAQAVPTDVARHRDGDYLVTTLGGFPFPAGHSIVYKVDRHNQGTAVCSTFPPLPASGCEVFADGLTALVGIDVGRRGHVYVVQFSDNGVLAAGPGAPGSVQVLNRRSGDVIGSITGLTLPGGVATHRNRVYISNNSVAAGEGQVVVARQVS